MTTKRDQALALYQQEKNTLSVELRELEGTIITDELIEEMTEELGGCEDIKDALNKYEEFDREYLDNIINIYEEYKKYEKIFGKVIDNFSEFKNKWDKNNLQKAKNQKDKNHPTTLHQII